MQSYTGVPLRTLLELAKIEMSESWKPFVKDGSKGGSFGVRTEGKRKSMLSPKPGLAVIIKNAEGKQVLLTLSEIMRDVENILVGGVKEKGSGKGLPMLVIRNDKAGRYTVKEITSLEVVRVQEAVLKGEGKQEPRILSGADRGECFLKDVFAECGRTRGSLDKKKAARAQMQTVSRDGVSMGAVFRKLGLRLDRTDVIAVTFRNGRSVLLSVREVSDPQNPVMITETSAGGVKSFNLVVAGEKGSSREMRDILQIQRIDMRHRPMIYVVGVGCGDNKLLTKEAVACMARADVFICMEKYRSTLGGYMSGKPVLFDPFLQLPKFYRKKHPELSEKEAVLAAAEVYKKDMQMIQESLHKGKVVALLEPGDPTLFGGWRNWLSPRFKGDVVKVTPGISSFNAANAMLGVYNLTDSSIIITDPEILKKDDSIVQSTARTEGVMVIFMGLTRFKDLMPIFRKHFDGDTPVYLIYEAGISGGEIKVKTTLADAVRDIEANREKFLGLIYIGKKLGSAK